MRQLYCKCPKCNVEAWHKKTQSAAVGFDCSGCGAVIMGGKQRATPAWGATGGRSLRFAFNPKTQERWKQDLPSAEVDATGAMVYRSDSHQRKVFKEMAVAKEKYEAKTAASLERKRRETGDATPECPIDISPSPYTGAVPAEFASAGAPQ
jgi:hypothetical protein